MSKKYKRVTIDGFTFEFSHSELKKETFKFNETCRLSLPNSNNNGYLYLGNVLRKNRDILTNVSFIIKANESILYSKGSEKVPFCYMTTKKHIINATFKIEKNTIVTLEFLHDKNATKLQDYDLVYTWLDPQTKKNTKKRI